ncbi:MAG: lipid-A-disaccharide synthase [Proteobacteria bacterium]|nr:lipid-A-disaccharide synthase [Pseudomonadota bacterium]
MNRPVRIALVAGEASGDQLAAGLIKELKISYPDCQFVGVAGPAMQAAGCEAWFDSEELAVMGLAEVLRHLPRIYSLRRELIQRLLHNPPDLFIGIDAPDFNLGLEKKLKAKGMPTVHYVSPSVWAWRQKRVKKIHKSVDRMLTLFPFEPDFYREHGVDARFVGHPMADEIPLESDPARACAMLGLKQQSLDIDKPLNRPRYIALLPGSRQSEVERLGETMLATAKLIHRAYPECHFLVPLANPGLSGLFRAMLPPELPVTCFDGKMREVVAASEVVLAASGTATLETLLIGRPMVVCYKLAAFTYFIARSFKLIKSTYFSLPNILAGKRLVPEYAQDQASPENLATAVMDWLQQPGKQLAVKLEFQRIHLQLRQNASKNAVAAIKDLLP